MYTVRTYYRRIDCVWACVCTHAYIHSFGCRIISYGSVFLSCSRSFSPSSLLSIMCVCALFCRLADSFYFCCCRYTHLYLYSFVNFWVKIHLFSLRHFQTGRIFQSNIHLNILLKMCVVAFLAPVQLLILCRANCEKIFDWNAFLV